LLTPVGADFIVQFTDVVRDDELERVQIVPMGIAGAVDSVGAVVASRAVHGRHLPADPEASSMPVQSPHKQRGVLTTQYQ
jgi:hypothetical protein